MALSVDDRRLAGWIAIAPALPVADTAHLLDDPRPKLVVLGEHDDLVPPGSVEPVVAAWPNVTVEVVPGADHFFAGRTDRVAAAATTWLAALRS